MQSESRDVILREEDYAVLLREASSEFGRWVTAVAADRSLLLMPGTMARLAETGHVLETFLDDHGARENRTFVVFGELVASVRGLAVVLGTGVHLLHRLPRYKTKGGVDDLGSELRRGLEAVRAALAALCDGTVNEGQKLGLTWPPITVFPSDRLLQRKLLPRNLDVDLSVDEREHIAHIVTKLSTVLEGARQLQLSELRPRDALQAFVADHATEERCRYYESAVHNVQSMYDTYVLRTALEQKHEWLGFLRGHASVSLHLLEMATGLVHFYERHENDIRHLAASEAVSALVGKESILDVAVNVCLRQAYLCIEGASEVADRILETFTAQGTTILRMPEGVTLHARPLALIVQVVRHHGTPVEISIEGESCSANSLMSLIMLGAAHPRPTSIEAKGEAAALRDLESLFRHGLGEADEPLPPELGYLKTS